MPEFGAPPPFELVKQFNNMRQGVSGGLPALGPAVSGDSAAAGTGYTSTNNGPGMPTMAPGGGQGLVDFGGKKVSAGLAPFAQYLVGTGLRLSGGYRSPEQNARTKGAAKNSYHMRQGESGALDLVGTARQMQDGAAWAKANGAKETLIHNAGSGLHLHVAW